MHPALAQALAPFAPPAPTVPELQKQVNDLQEELNFYLETLNYIYDGIQNQTIWDVNQVKMICARVLP
jgi:hypothetical protein